MIRARQVVVVVALAAALAGPAAGLARAEDKPAGGGHGAAPEAAPHDDHYHPMDLRAVAVQTLGFAILAILLGKFAIPILGKALRDRRDKIRDTLEGLERDEKSAVAAKSEAEARLKDVERGAADRIERALQEGHQLREQLTREGEEQAGKIAYKAKLEAEIERQKMLLELRNEVVDVAFSAARMVAAQAVDRQTQDALVDRYIDDLDDVLVDS